MLKNSWFKIIIGLLGPLFLYWLILHIAFWPMASRNEEELQKALQNKEKCSSVFYKGSFEGKLEKIKYVQAVKRNPYYSYDLTCKKLNFEQSFSTYQNRCSFGINPPKKLLRLRSTKLEDGDISEGDIFTKAADSWIIKIYSMPDSSYKASLDYQKQEVFFKP